MNQIISIEGSICLITNIICLRYIAKIARRNDELSKENQALRDHLKNILLGKKKETVIPF